MKLELEQENVEEKSELSDFYVDFSLKLLAALKVKVQSHNSSSPKKFTLNQVIQSYCAAANNYIKNETVDINTYSMACVNEMLEGKDEDISMIQAKEDVKKFDLEFDFKNFNDLYISPTKGKPHTWFEI